jgi:hypothetical protein
MLFKSRRQKIGVPFQPSESDLAIARWLERHPREDGRPMIGTPVKGRVFTTQRFVDRSPRQKRVAA